MSGLRVAIVGAGKRVLETALPSLRAAGEPLALEGIYARSARGVESSGATVEVRPLDELLARGLDGVDLVYLAVGKDAVPGVLASLAALRPTRTDLLIETPVVRFRHFRHASRVTAFRNAWVAEDCAWLPWFDTLDGAISEGVIDRPRAVWFDQAAYAYHAVATARRILGGGRVLHGRRRKLSGRFAMRDLRFSGGGTAHILEPRDYDSGRIVLMGPKGSVSDFPLTADGNSFLQVLQEEDRCTGFRIGDIRTDLDDSERELCTRPASGAGVIAIQEDMKRVGFLRIWRSIAGGAGAHRIEDGLEDMVVDYALERLGRYRATPFTSPRGPIGRMTLSLLTRAGG